MNKVANIKYIDASYSYEKECPTINIKTHEAFGYFKEKNDDIFLEFIKKEKGTKNTIIKGLIIPHLALLSNYKKYNNTGNFKKGSEVSITWKDIVYVANTSRQKSSTMFSKGVVYKDTKKYVVLEKPKTHRNYPKPKISHPEKQPNFYIIPKCLIIK
jgi:hypothetical protein